MNLEKVIRELGALVHYYSSQPLIIASIGGGRQNVSTL
jgi:hypothetical protein